MTGRVGKAVPAEAEPARDTGGRPSTADKTLDILLMFGEQRRTVSAVEVAQQLGVARSTAYRYLQSLLASGFLEEAESGGYRLGKRLLRLAWLARRTMEVPVAARPVMRELAAEVGEVVLLTSLSGHAVVCLERADGSTQQMRISYRAGQALPLNAGASAYVLLAWLPPEQARELLGGAPLRRFTHQTLVSADSVLRRLEETRAQGYAVSRGELDQDVLGVAAPIRGSGGRVVAAISIAAVSSLVPDDRVPALAASVRIAADAISVHLNPER